MNRPRTTVSGARAAGRTVFLLLSLWAAGAAPDARAQDPGGERPGAEVSGRVMDAATGAPIAGASIRGVGSERVVRTGLDGSFRFVPEDITEHGVTIEHMAYRPVVLGPGSLRPGVPITVRLQPDPLLLEAIEVVADRLEERRRRAPFSVQVYEQDDLSLIPMTALDFLMRRVPLLTSGCGGGGGAMPGGVSPVSPGGRMDPSVAAGLDVVLGAGDARRFGGWADYCIALRGGTRPVSLIVDEFPWPGSFAELSTFSTEEIHTIEVIGMGRQIRVYTRRFMARTIRGEVSAARIMPVIFVPFW